MPLLDHFCPPLSARRHWHSFHNAWAANLSANLNELLPEPFFAEANVQFGIEIDIAAFEDCESSVARPTANWTPPAPTVTVPMTALTDIVEVQVFESTAGPLLCAAIELVSPSNKDRPASRDAFLNKCAAYLQQGVGLIVVDIVTERHANLHDGLLERLAGSSPAPGGSLLFASAYHPSGRTDHITLDVWFEALSIGATLPILPLWLRGGPCIPLALESSYARTRFEQRIPDPGADKPS